MASREIARYRTPASRVVGALTAAFLALFVVWTVLPIFIMFVSSFKDLLQAFQLPPVGQWSGIAVFFDFEPTLRHYENLFGNLGFSRYFMNSLLASLGSALISVVLGAMAAYSLSRAEFRGKKDLLFWIISTRMAPVVPIVKAIRSGPVQPLPRLAAAPSPTAGNQGTSFKAGQRSAHSPFKPLNGSSTSVRGERFSSLIGRWASQVWSQVSSRRLSKPVQEAME